MSAPRRNPPSRRSDADTPSALTEVGLRVGDTVRFRRGEAENWREGTVVNREKDGSIGVRDAKGAARAIPVDRLQVRGRGPRGGVVWEPLQDRQGKTEQLGLL
jgi:hypothetical protein